jgi:hypothetical protein
MSSPLARRFQFGTSAHSSETPLALIDDEIGGTENLAFSNQYEQSRRLKGENEASMKPGTRTVSCRDRARVVARSVPEK